MIQQEKSKLIEEFKTNLIEISNKILKLGQVDQKFSKDKDIKKILSENDPLINDGKR